MKVTSLDRLSSHQDRFSTCSAQCRAKGDRLSSQLITSARHSSARCFDGSYMAQDNSSRRCRKVQHNVRETSSTPRLRHAQQVEGHRAHLIMAQDVFSSARTRGDRLSSHQVKDDRALQHDSDMLNSMAHHESHNTLCTGSDTLCTRMYSTTLHELYTHVMARHSMIHHVFCTSLQHGSDTLCTAQTRSVQGRTARLATGSTAWLRHTLHRLTTHRERV